MFSNHKFLCTMVTVIDFKTRKNAQEKDFNVLILQGDIELLKSQTTGRFYATARTCSISCTFNEVVCKALIGKQLPGRIEKMECDPYDYQIPNSDEVIRLNYIYYYDISPKTMEEEVFEGKAAA